MRPITRSTLRSVTIAISLMLAIAACSGEDGDQQAATSTTAATATSTQPEQDPVGEDAETDGGSDPAPSAGGCEPAVDALLRTWEDGGEGDAVNSATVDSLKSCSRDEWVDAAQPIDDFLEADGGYVGDVDNLCRFAADYVVTDEGGDPEDLTAC